MDNNKKIAVTKLAKGELKPVIHTEGRVNITLCGKQPLEGKTS